MDGRGSKPDLVRIRTSTGPSSTYLEVESFSNHSKGIEAVIPIEVSIRIGERLEIQLVSSGQRQELSGVVVGKDELDGKFVKLVIRFFLTHSVVEAPRDSRSRSEMRWVCNNQLFPIAVAASPGYFEEFLRFRVRDISRSGLRLVAEARYAFLVPKMPLTLTINLPMVGSAVIETEVVWVALSKESLGDEIELGVNFVGPSTESTSLLGQYLSQFGASIPIEELVRESMVPNNSVLGIEFRDVKSADEFESVLSLRRQAGVDADSSKWERDKSTRLLIGYLDHKPVITCRVHYPPLQGKFFCEAEVHDLSQLPPVHQSIEVEAIAFVSELLTTERAMFGLFRFVCTSCTNVNRTHVVAMVSEGRQLLERVGWTCVHVGVDCSVLTAGPARTFRGQEVQPILWDYVWGQFIELQRDRTSAGIAGSDRFISKLLATIRPLSSWWIERRLTK